MIKVEIAKASDYGEIIQMSNAVFNLDFGAEMPKLYKDTPKVAEFHRVVRDNGKIVSSILFYPQILNVCGEKLNVLCVGTVATLPEYRNKGLMSAIFSAAESHIKNYDLAVLGGQRQRYEYFGFIPLGMQKVFWLNKRNLKDIKSDFNISALEKDDLTVLKKINAVNEKRPLYVKRGSALFDALHSDGNKPYIITKDGKFDGYFCYKNKEISEIHTSSANAAAKSIMRQFEIDCIKINSAITDLALNAELEKTAEVCSITHCCNMRIINERKVTDAFSKLIVPVGENIGFLQKFGISGISMNGGFPLPLFYPKMDNV